MALNRYGIHIYHGGESSDEILFTNSLDEAKSLLGKGEHVEIMDLKTKTII